MSMCLCHVNLLVIQHRKCRSLYPICLAVHNVSQHLRRDTIQPMALVPSVKGHIEQFLVAHNRSVSDEEKEATERRTMIAMWKTLLAPLHNASHPDTGVRACDPFHLGQHHK